VRASTLYNQTAIDCSLSQYEVGEKHPVMGSALSIVLPAGLKAGSTTTVTISYKTHKDATALQWLAKE
jgi:leukotriene-A4 hydrolase